MTQDKTTQTDGKEAAVEVTPPYLLQADTNDVFVYSPHLAKRSDMVPHFGPDVADTEPKAATAPKKPAAQTK